MPKRALVYLHMALTLVAAVLVIIGGIVFQATVSFEGYIGGLLIMALGVVAFIGARQVKPAAEGGDARAQAHYRARKRIR